MRRLPGYLTAVLFSFVIVWALPHNAIAADDETNKQILKDAVVGAVTGAVATEATKDEPKETVSEEVDKAAGDTDKKHHGKHKKDKNIKSITGTTISKKTAGLPDGTRARKKAGTVRICLRALRKKSMRGTGMISTISITNIMGITNKR